MSTVFQKIIQKEIPADIVYEDEHCLAFRDINPQAPTHVLLVPKKEIPTVDDLSKDDAALMGHLMIKVAEIARTLDVAEHGYRIVVNCKNQGGQEVPHLHFHILAGRQMTWPPG